VISITKPKETLHTQTIHTKSTALFTAASNVKDRLTLYYPERCNIGGDENAGVENVGAITDGKP